MSNNNNDNNRKVSRYKISQNDGRTLNLQDMSRSHSASVFLRIIRRIGRLNYTESSTVKKLRPFATTDGFSFLCKTRRVCCEGAVRNKNICANGKRVDRDSSRRNRR